MDIMNCKECFVEIPHKNKFCSRSCAAKFNNSKRVRTVQSRMKTSGKLIKHGRFCRFSELVPADTIKLKEERMLTSSFKQPLGGMNYCRYEEKVHPLLEMIYGPLRKEVVNGIAIDFANDTVIIEFTIDVTAGISSIIKRFLRVNDHRKKIAYVPIKRGFGVKRLKKLTDLGVTVLDSCQYKDITDVYKFTKYL